MDQLDPDMNRIHAMEMESISYNLLKDDVDDKPDFSLADYGKEFWICFYFDFLFNWYIVCQTVDPNEVDNYNDPYMSAWRESDDDDILGFYRASSPAKVLMTTSTTFNKQSVGKKAVNGKSS